MLLASPVVINCDSDPKEKITIPVATMCFLSRVGGRNQLSWLRHLPSGSVLREVFQAYLDQEEVLR